MKRSETIITVVAAGSLWGLFEIMHMPTGILCAVGIFFLILARSMVNLPGSSTMIGAIVCLFKMYSAHFMMCQTAGVMSLAVSFDILAVFFWNAEGNRILNTTLLVAAANIVALPVFLFWVNIIAPITYWTEGGLDRMLWYATSSVLPAILLGAITGNAARMLSERTAIRKVPGLERVALRVMLPSVVVAWSIASVVKFL